MNIVSSQTQALKFPYLLVVGKYRNDSFFSLTYELHDNPKYGNRWKWANGIKIVSQDIFKERMDSFYIVGVNCIGEKIEGVEHGLQKDSMDIFFLPPIVLQIKSIIKHAEDNCILEGFDR